MPMSNEQKDNFVRVSTAVQMAFDNLDKIIIDLLGEK